MHKSSSPTSTRPSFLLSACSASDAIQLLCPAVPSSEIFAISTYARYGYQCKSLPKEEQMVK